MLGWLAAFVKSHAKPQVKAEADGNRTRRAGIAGPTGFEDREGHQSPVASRGGMTPIWRNTDNGKFVHNPISLGLIGIYRDRWWCWAG